jgi:hypothetical protein
MVGIVAVLILTLLIIIVRRTRLARAARQADEQLRQQQLQLKQDRIQNQRERLELEKQRLATRRALTPIGRLTPTEFEHEVETIFAELTNFTARHVGRAGDGGVDVELYHGEQLVGVVQAKRFDPGRPLPPEYIRSLDSVRRARKAHYAYLVTTAYFSDNSKALAQQLDIRLMDGAEFMAKREQVIDRRSAVKLSRLDDPALTPIAPPKVVPPKQAQPPKPIPAPKVDPPVAPPAPPPRPVAPPDLSDPVEAQLEARRKRLGMN